MSNTQTIVVMTPEQLRDYSLEILREYDRMKDQQQPQESKEYVYGIRGISELFHVSLTTANEYKKTILKDAVSQRGRKIITDVAMARKLFSDHKGN